MAKPTWFGTAADPYPEDRGEKKILCNHMSCPIPKVGSSPSVECDTCQVFEWFRYMSAADALLVIEDFVKRHTHKKEE